MQKVLKTGRFIGTRKNQTKKNSNNNNNKFFSLFLTLHFLLYNQQTTQKEEEKKKVRQNWIISTINFKHYYEVLQLNYPIKTKSIHIVIA